MLKVSGARDAVELTFARQIFIVRHRFKLGWILEIFMDLINVSRLPLSLDHPCVVGVLLLSGLFAPHV